MKSFRILSMASLRDEMIAVARGERPAPPDAGTMTFDSVEVVTRLLTPENRQLLAVIRDRKPRSVAELAQMTGRAQPNLTRTLAKLEGIGLITLETSGRRKAPRVAVGKILIEIDPYSDIDRLHMTSADEGAGQQPSGSAGQLEREERAPRRRIKAFRIADRLARGEAHGRDARSSRPSPARKT